MLDANLFQLISSTRDDRNNSLCFEGYKVVNDRSTMILFSRKTKTPLAALTLTANKDDDHSCLTMLTGRPSPNNATEPYFQGMINKPDSNFNFTITNLSNDGMINFNILHTSHHVSEVNPGPAYGINEVNELHTNQSYTVEADQRTNRQMILHGRTKLITSPGTSQLESVPVSVKETESTNERSTGLYFYLSVVPDIACKSLVSKFEEGTVWKVTPYFVRRFTATRNGLRGGNWAGSPSPQMYAQMASMQSEGASNSLRGGFSLSSRSSAIPSQQYCFMSVSRRLESSGVGSMDRVTQQSASASLIQQSQFHHRSLPTFKEQSNDFVDVSTTQAGELTYGRHVNVYSHETGRNYDYEHCSEPTVLCMSIWEEMSFLPLPDIKEEVSNEVEEWKKNEGKVLIESLNAVYKSDTCVIDLESDADTIICTCGHQCVNHTNVDSKLRHCPMCRSPITAFVRADGLIV